MRVDRLDWDSSFFGHNIYSVRANSAEDFVESVNELKRSNAELVYVFAAHKARELDDVIRSMGGELYDQKVVYRKDSLSSGVSCPQFVKEYKGKETEQLYDLALSAGHESRFRKDPRLNSQFRALYKIWLENSLAGRIADRVYVSQDNEGINGFVTCVVKDNCGVIGLIATAENRQGRGIGRALVEAAESYYKDRGIGKSLVVTQLANKRACSFYERCGFEVDVIENVYHLWL